MPHDKNGNVLKVGDFVNVPCEVMSVSQSEDACNVTVRTRYEPQGGTYMPLMTMNSKQVELVESAPEMATAGFLDLLALLKQLKDLVGSDYFGDLKDIALAALDQDWEKVVDLVFDLAKKWTKDRLVPKAKLAVMPDPAIYAEMEAAFSELENATVVVATNMDAKLDPATWLAIISGIFKLIQFINDRKKK